MVTSEPTEQEIPPGTLVLRRYQVVGKLAQGGMAELLLARQIGPAGYQKLVVVKRVRPHLATDKDFVAMFVNEARLAAMINHPNVVQIFDLGSQGADWFLAMEYLDGRDMLQVGRACRSHNKAVPFDVTARIIADACSGLEYAHNLKGSEGQRLDLVHRDMSPENIIITFEGQVKVVDFGIAKAADNTLQTQAGQIKGKLGYVAPEAILGKPLDARADIFAIGATLYLFLCGRPAFAGNSPMEIFERSLKPPAAPREVNPRVPPELDQICMKALAQDRDKRFRTAGDVRAALEGYLSSTGRPLGPPQLSQFMKILFPPEKDPIRLRTDKLLNDAASFGDGDETNPSDMKPDLQQKRSPRTISVNDKRHVTSTPPRTREEEPEEPTAIVPPERLRSAPAPLAVELPGQKRQTSPIRAPPPPPPPTGPPQRLSPILPTSRAMPPLSGSGDVRTEVSAELASDLFDEVHPSEPSGSSSLIDEAPQAAATIEGDTAHSIEVSASVASDTAPETSDAFRRAATVGLTSSRSDAPELSSPAGVPPEAPPMDVAIGAALFDEAPPAIVPPAIVARPSLGMRLAMLGVGAVAGAIFVALALAVTGTFGPLMARMGLRSQSVETSVESTR